MKKKKKKLVMWFPSSWRKPCHSRKKSKIKTWLVEVCPTGLLSKLPSFLTRNRYQSNYVCTMANNLQTILHMYDLSTVFISSNIRINIVITERIAYLWECSEPRNTSLFVTLVCVVFIIIIIEFIIIPLIIKKRFQLLCL